MAHAWKACWVHALTSSNLVSSASKGPGRKSGLLYNSDFLAAYPSATRPHHMRLCLFGDNLTYDHPRSICKDPAPGMIPGETRRRRRQCNNNGRENLIRHGPVLFVIASTVLTETPRPPHMHGKPRLVHKWIRLMIQRKEAIYDSVIRLFCPEPESGT